MLDRVVQWLRAAPRVTFLTGAGVSAESGVPVFRGPAGLWRQFRPEDLATPDAFRRRPELVWEWYLWRRSVIRTCEPHAGHVMIADLERARPGVTVVTQNVDGLHQRAGSSSPLEVHGNLWRVRCADGCGHTRDDRPGDTRQPALRCSCGSWLRPAVVWFGEPLDRSVLEAASDAVERADLLLVVGTSAVVYPVAALPDRARRRGARVVEVNVEETPLTDRADAVLRGPAGVILPQLWRA
jgi:NAD-dependent deacetylase